MPHDHFHQQAAMVDGCSIWGAFLRIILPIALISLSVSGLVMLFFIRSG